MKVGYSVYLWSVHIYFVHGLVLSARWKRQVGGCLIPGILCGGVNARSRQEGTSVGLGQNVRIPILDALGIPVINSNLGSSGGIGVNKRTGVNLRGSDNIFGLVDRNRGINIGPTGSRGFGVSGGDSLGFLGGLLGLNRQGTQ